MAHRLFDFSNLTPAQRVDLAIELWDSLPAESDEPPISEAQRAELLRRAESYRRDRNAGAHAQRLNIAFAEWTTAHARPPRRDPKAGAPWNEVRARIQKSRRPER